MERARFFQKTSREQTNPQRKGLPKNSSSSASVSGKFANKELKKFVQTLTKKNKEKRRLVWYFWSQVKVSTKINDKRLQ
jgi:hypothetical protein